MGHFSFSCSLTGLPITSNTPVALLPLFPRNGWYDNSEEKIRKYGKVNYCSNECEEIFFRPMTFPIFGTYNSYGKMENIIEDDNTKILEEFFDLTIQQISDIICSGRKEDGHDEDLKVLNKKNENQKFLIKASGAWIHKGVYDELVKSNFFTFEEDGLDLGVPGILKGLGFKEVGKNKDERFNRSFVQGNVTLNSDGNWINAKNINGIYSLCDLKEYCSKQGLEINIEEMNKQSNSEQIYRYILPYVKDLKGRDRWETERVIEMLLGDAYECAMDSGLSKITKIYFESIKKNKKDFLLNNIIGYKKVKLYFFLTGKFLSPAGTSPQDGEPEGVLNLLNIAQKVLSAEIEESKKH